MRVLGIETSTRRGSVAAVEDGQVLASLAHEEPNAHAERLLPLLERLLVEVGWSRSSLDRLAVGIGPGSFTGLRVGIALAQGIALGLGRPLVGIGSLRAMARGVDAGERRTRVTVLDARRGEYFVAAYDATGTEIVAPFAAVKATARAELAAQVPAGELVLVGECAGELGTDLPLVARADLNLPHASWVAVLGEAADEASARAEPEYVRGPGATLPNLPPSPLALPKAE